MCTIGYCKTLNVIFKNRDKDATLETEEEIFTDNSILAARTIGADYFSWGMNRNGCAFVSAAINTPEWTRLLYDGKIKKAEEQYDLENKGLTSPMKTLSNMLSGVQRIEQMLTALTESTLLFKGYNILIADGQNAYLVETFRDKREVRKLTTNEVITNHFKSIKHGPKTPEDYSSSFRRYDYACSKIGEVKSISDVAKIIKPSDNQTDAECIWRDGVFSTISSSIIDFEEGMVYYANGLNDQYSNFRLQRPVALQSIVDEEGMRHFEMSRYIDLDLYHEVEKNHAFYVEMVEAILETINEKCDARKKYKALELGAGTGLFTSYLLDIPNVTVTALELDLGCCAILKDYINQTVLHGDAVSFCREGMFDLVVSTFVHDHICYDDADKFAKNIFNNLKDGGFYIMGGEILPKYETMEEREEALYLYHGMIVDKALKNKDYRLAQIEINALESGVGMVGDFKRHEELFEKEMIGAGFTLSMKKKIGPLDNGSVGGVFVYCFAK
jgi:SAM-dependent methyltransferase